MPEPRKPLAPLVTKSYEERIIDALANLPRKRGEHFMERGQREFTTIRAILQPLYDREAATQQVIEAARAVARKPHAYYASEWRAVCEALADLDALPEGRSDGGGE